MVVSSFRGRADQAMRPATQLRLGRFRLSLGRVGNEFVQQRAAPPKHTSRTHNSSGVGGSRCHRHLLQILPVFPGLGSKLEPLREPGLQEFTQFCSRLELRNWFEFFECRSERVRETPDRAPPKLLVLWLEVLCCRQHKPTMWRRDLCGVRLGTHIKTGRSRQTSAT